MRILLFVLTTISSAVALSAQPISGSIAVFAKSMYLNAQNEPCTRYEITSKKESALAALIKLSNGDVITATGIKDPASCKVIIESVDFVGLKRLLGLWYSKDGVLAVQDFNLMRYYPAGLPALIESSNPDAAPVDYKYRMVPSEGKEWVLFLSNTFSTTFATIQFSTKGTATMKTYDSESGNITKTMVLTRKGPLN
jgi:hypothetical protein